MVAVGKVQAAKELKVAEVDLTYSYTTEDSHKDEIKVDATWAITPIRCEKCGKRDVHR